MSIGREQWLVDLDRGHLDLVSGLLLCYLQLLDGECTEKEERVLRTTPR